AAGAYRGDRDYVRAMSANYPINEDFRPVSEYFIGLAVKTALGLYGPNPPRSLAGVGHEDVFEEPLLVLDPGGKSLPCQLHAPGRPAGDVDRLPRVGLQVVQLHGVRDRIVDELAGLFAISEKHLGARCEQVGAPGPVVGEQAAPLP